MSSSISSHRTVTRDRTIRTAVTIALSTIAIGSPAVALDKHWNNANALWGNSLAWSPNGVPGTADIVSVDRAGGDGAAQSQRCLARRGATRRARTRAP